MQAESWCLCWLQIASISGRWSLLLGLLWKASLDFLFLGRSLDTFLKDEQIKKAKLLLTRARRRY